MTLSILRVERILSIVVVPLTTHDILKDKKCHFSQWSLCTSFPSHARSALSPSPTLSRENAKMPRLPLQSSRSIDEQVLASLFVFFFPLRVGSKLLNIAST